jgi:molecular chaperone HtpG
MVEKVETSQHEFKAEVRQLLDILARSLYSNKEVFLRELISNASDALDKLRFEINRGTQVADDDLELEIKIELDDTNGVLRMTDTGVGMSREELIQDIGTIARSGSSEFIKLAASDKSRLDGIIGKFGVGFYSVFMVAKEVVITTRSYRKEEAPVRWSSDGVGAFEIGAAEGEVKRGTTVEIFLQDEEKEFAAKYRIENVIKKHSSFVSFPIKVAGELAG